MVDNTLTELCQDLRNWFDRARYIGSITIGPDGGVYCDGIAVCLAEGQYYRIIGSTFADGVHVYPDADNKQESFDGAVWAMAVPPPVLQLVEDIAAWREKYEVADSSAMSPFFAESFGGYSYSKSVGAGTKISGTTADWKSAFASRLSAYRKL